MKLFSRRQFAKLGASLFAFVPAIGYLAASPKTFADDTCDNIEFIVCTYVETECANYDCLEYNTLYDVSECVDERSGVVCYYTFDNTNVRC